MTIKMRVACIAGCLLVLSFGFTAILVRRSSSNANISISPNSIDLGGVLQQTVQRAVFTIRNNSQHDVELFVKGKSCSCTTATLSKDHLQGGETADLTVLIDTSDKIGNFVSNVLVASRDQTSEKQLPVSVRLRPERIAIPNLTHLELGTIDADQSIVNSSIVIKKGESPVQWSSITAKAKVIGNVETIKSGEDTIIKYVANFRNAPLGRFRDLITLRFITADSHLLQSLDIPVDATIKADVSYSPNTLYLSIAKPDTKLTGAITIRTTNKSAITMVSMAAMTLPVEFSCAQTQTDLLSVRYSIAIPHSEQNINDNFVLDVKTDRIRQIKIPIIGYVRM